MFTTVYSILIAIASSLLKPISFFHPRIKSFRQARKQGPQIEAGKRKYWFHCASLGEFEMLRPILDPLMEKVPRESILISFFSPSGFEQIAKHEKYRDLIIYLPWDSATQVREFYKRYQPEFAIFMRYDLWYNILRLGLRNKTKFYLVNARFRENHFVFKAWARPYFKLLKQFNALYCSDKRSEEILLKKGLSNAEFLGDTRYDRVLDIAAKLEDIPMLAQFKGEENLLIMGSSWAMEEKLMAEIFHELEDCKLLIAPHIVTEDNLLAVETEFAAYAPKRWSGGDLKKADRVVVLDNVGMLSSMYRYADISFIGGGFRGALHNITEAAVWGNLILFGPDTKKFPEADDFVEAGFAKSVANERELVHSIKEFLQEDRQKEIKQKAIDFVQAQSGASPKILQILETS